MIILGIESSCDETAAAIVEDGKKILSNIVVSQIDIHAKYGGVIPEIAARSHVEVINAVIKEALIDAGLTWRDIDAIGVTYAPGLVGSLLIGTLAARTVAMVHNKPLYKIHHVEAHSYAAFITNDATNKIKELPEKFPIFPILSLTVSGGHSQLAFFKKHGNYQIIGQTQDDAIGEAFDKVAKIIGLPYPGGPSISQVAEDGNENRFQFPKAKMSPKDKNDKNYIYNFSFSGLKTAVLRTVQKETGVDFTYPSFKLPELVSDNLQKDIAASFQKIAVETLVDKVKLAIDNLKPKSLIVAGGVAANKRLRSEILNNISIPVNFAPIPLCTDNAVMIGALTYYRSQINKPADIYNFEINPSLSMEKAYED